MSFPAVLLLVGSLSWLANAGELRAACQDGRQLERRAASALRRGQRAWQGFLEDQKALGPAARGALVVVLQARQEVLVERVERSSLKKQYDRMLVRRQRLDAARRHALELIFDEQTYFYPYRQPDVSAEVAALSPPVQTEVDERVAKVRQLWEDSSAAVIPDILRREAEQIRWVSEALVALDGPDGARPEMQARVEWLLTLPESGPLTLQGFCLSTEEVQQHSPRRREAGGTRGGRRRQG